MKKLFLILLSVFFFMFSCKTRKVQHNNNNFYDTPPEIGRLTTDLPRYSRPPVPNTLETTTISPPKTDLHLPYSVTDTLDLNTDIPIQDTIQLNNKSVIQTLNSSDFSWEIGIKITQIVDVRTLEEFKSGHIYDAVNMNVDDPSFIHQIQTLDKNSPVAVYCRSGVRSLHAAKILQENGFPIIYNLKGGLNQWKKDGKEVVK